MGVILAYIKLGFKNNTIYRVNYLLGLIGAAIQLFITIAIWRALYNGQDVIDGISFSMITTNFVFTIGLQNAFTFNDFEVQSKVNDGSIALDFIKPVDYRMNLLATDVGNIIFNIMVKFVPIFILAFFVVGIEKPASLISVNFGFSILWSLTYIVRMTTFWILNVWSVSVLKGVIISVFSGITLPIWFLPEGITNLLKFTPLESIYFMPLQIYWGQVTSYDILTTYLIQIMWAVVLFSIGNIMWKFGRKRLIVQGG